MKVYENDKLIDDIEKILVQQRGYAFKMPPPKTPVAVLFSGGLDSAVVAALLADKYKLLVYPYYFYRHLPHSKQTYKAAQQLARSYAQKWPSQWMPLQKIDLWHPSSTLHYIHNDTFHFDVPVLESWPVTPPNQATGIPFSQHAYVHHIVLDILLGKGNRKIRTIFGSAQDENRTLWRYENLTSARLLTLELCEIVNDKSWQFTHLPLEPSLHIGSTKQDLIKIGNKLGIDLGQTWTCSRNMRFQCGTCDLCTFRQADFRLAKITDPTIYEINRKDRLGIIKRFFLKQYPHMLWPTNKIKEWL